MPESYHEYDTEQWEAGVDAAKMDVKELKAYLGWRVSYYKTEELKDFGLWEAFAEDFSTFTRDILQSCGSDKLRKLRDHLIDNGVHVYKAPGASMAKELLTAMNPENAPKIGTSTGPIPQSTAPQPTSQEQPATQSTTPSRTANTQPHGYGRELSNLAKFYDDDSKYSGESDNFDFKFIVFSDLCERADIPQKARAKAFPTMLRGLALDYYYSSLKRLPLEKACELIKKYFEGDEYKRGIMSKWNSITLKSMIEKHQPEGKSVEECLQLLIKELRHLQHGLDMEFGSDKFLLNKLINACQEIPACQYACYKPADNLAGFINDLRSSITTYEKARVSHENTETFFTDRRYHRHDSQRPTDRFANGRYNKGLNSNKKKCFICNKEGCWSTKHTAEERERSKKKFQQRFSRRVDQYIAEYEGKEESDQEEELEEEMEALILSARSPSPDSGSRESSEAFLTSFGNVNGYDIAATLADQSVHHAITGSDYALNGDTDPFIYAKATEGRYTSKKFYGIMIDTGASTRSTAGYGQYLAYKELSNIDIDKSEAGAINVQFGIGSTPSIGSIMVVTPFGDVKFHVVEADTPFLLCLKDMDSLGIYFNNLKNILISPNYSVSVVRQFGHPFLLWNESLSAFLQDSLSSSSCFLTDTELRQLHRRFGHPSANRLIRLLERSGHGDKLDKEAIHKLTKFCVLCQRNGKSPGRFKFTLRDENIDFNHSIIVDVMYITGSPLLHVVDEATRFQAARWLPNISAQATWNALRLCWIDVYIGPPDLLIHDAGTNFTGREFQQCATSMAISTKCVPVEAHQSIGIVERYHAPLRRAYSVISEELKGTGTGVTRDMVLQMAIKAVNDTAGPDGLIPTLLVFGAYPRMVELDPPAPTITQRATAIKRAMEEVVKLRASRQVAEALRQRNGPQTQPVHELPINSDVLVWRENSHRWTGPFKLLSMEEESCKVQLPSGPTDFRSTVVKPYLNEHEQQPQNQGQQPQIQDDSQQGQRRNPRRARRLPARYQDHNVADISILVQEVKGMGHLSGFIESRQKELNGLLEKGCFEIVAELEVPRGVRIFNSRFVDEIKNEGTDKAFEKSRLVVQAFNDTDKDLVLTQAPTIQRVSQRIILSIAAALRDKGLNLYLRDISQAYVQSNTQLNRDFFVRPPKELQQQLQLPMGSVLRVVKPLYGVPEAGNHWFNTYHNHHIQKLRMKQSTYDPCLLYTTEGFGLVGLQTDDTIFLADEEFATREETELQKAKLLAKPREKLAQDCPIKFNGGIIKLTSDGIITLTQERHCSKIGMVNIGDGKAVRKDQYIAQRARGAYIATVCQPEAAFDLSFAAQVVNPKENDAKALNRRLQWQLENYSRGLSFVKLDVNSLRLIVFTDSSFANNNDLSSQIGFVILLADKDNRANILHWSSVKCKRITRSVLASELYAMAHGFDTGSAIKGTIERILKRGVPLPLIVCTDSRSLYDCLVKLGTTHEKRLMIDLMCLRQSYERREIAEIKWIDGDSNPADAMTKTKPCQALRNLIETNTIHVEATGWVERVESNRKIGN